MNKPEERYTTKELAADLLQLLKAYNEEKSAIRWVSLKGCIMRAVSRLRELSEKESNHDES